MKKIIKIGAASLDAVEMVSSAFKRLDNYFPFTPRLYVQGNILSVEDVPEDHVESVKMLLFGVIFAISPASVHLLSVHDWRVS